MRPRNGNKWHQGYFKPLNPDKYVGDPSTIVYRSGWELNVMSRLDINPAVANWASEEIVVPYFDPTTKKNRRYFPDFLVKYTDGTVEMVEVKPAKEQVAPRKGKKSQRRFLSEAATYLMNQAKWKAAEEFCKAKGWKFRVVNEMDLGLRPRK